MLKCSYMHFPTMSCFNGGSMKKSLATLAWIASHHFGVRCLKLQTNMSKCEYATSWTFCCQYVLPLTISLVSYVGILTNTGHPKVTTCFNSFYSFPWNLLDSFLHTWLWVDINTSYGNPMCEPRYYETYTTYGCCGTRLPCGPNISGWVPFD